MKFKKLFFLVTIFVLAWIPSIAMEADMKTPEPLVIIMDSTNPAYTVISAIPESTKTNFEKNPDEASKKFTFSFIPMNAFINNPEQYLKDKILVSSFNTENFYVRFAELVTKYPKTPIGLVFNGGVERTANDYTHATRMYTIWKKDEANYHKIQTMPENKKWDPINPNSHFIPLLGK